MHPAFLNEIDVSIDSGFREFQDELAAGHEIDDVFRPFVQIVENLVSYF